MRRRALIVTCGALLACIGPAPEAVIPAQPAATTVKMDFFHRPLPDIPLPNDLATRYDPSSATGRRLNASMVAPTKLEARTRELIDRLDGWGTLQPIAIPFTGPLQVESILAAHRDEDYDLSDDVIYLIDVDRDSARFGEVIHLDLGQGNYPATLERLDRYWEHDPRGHTISLTYEETDEDLNDNGVLDPGEDSDADGVLDVPNYLPGANPAPDDLAARVDALMTFYERETNTLIVRPMMPLRERTTYAVVVTRRLLDADGEPVGSPFGRAHHSAQAEALRPLAEVLPAGLALDDVAFAFTFTTQSLQAGWQAVRDGLYGHGVQAHLATDYPAEVERFLPMRDEAFFPDSGKRHLMYGEQWKATFERLSVDLLDGEADSVAYADATRGADYIDYVVVGSFMSPQLFARTDDDGLPLPLNDQSWPEDLDRVPAEARAEEVFFTLVVPRPEISARGAGEPAPIAIMGHGYTSNRFEGLSFANFLAQHGLAVLSIDGPSHGIGINPDEHETAVDIFKGNRLAPAIESILTDRAWDQDGDGVKDSGADFWTSYLFHTRDMVRQFLLDYMQLIRIVKSFDGDRRWAHDTDGDGQPDLAGDFDGDGVLDIGAASTISMSGGSLGGILSMLVASLEPHLTAAAPIAGGGGYADMGLRSLQGGVVEAFVLRALGPLYVGGYHVDEDSGEEFQRIDTIVPSLNDEARVPLGAVTDGEGRGFEPGDFVIVENLANGERGCGYVNEQRGFRVSVESDEGDATRLLFFRGDAMILGSTHCEAQAGAQPFAVLDEFQQAITFQSAPVAAGTPLYALADGFGLRRGNPELRRIQAISQLVLDPADPATYARHLFDEPLTYPGTGETTGTHTLVVTTLGDMNVPASSGVTYGRAAGLIDYLEPDPRFGKPLNQVLIDTHVAEATHSYKRYTDPDGHGVHLDVENFSEGDDIYGDTIPRVDEPLRIGMDQTDPLGGVSAAIFPYTKPDGQHGFEQPGGQIDIARRRCREACATEATVAAPDPCGCAAVQPFDIGRFMFNMLGRYFASEGKSLSADRCQSRVDCDDLLPPPAPRDPSELD